MRSATEKYHKVLLEYFSQVQNQLEFNKSYQEMSASVVEGIENKNNEIEQFKSELRSEQNSLIKKTGEFNEEKERYNEKIDKYITEVEGIVGALAERSISYGFQRIADEEKHSKEKWNKLT